MRRLILSGLLAITALIAGLACDWRPSLGVSSLDFPAAVAGSASRWPGPFRVEVLNVKDGDTLAVTLTDHCPFGCIDRDGSPVIAVRLRGIDAPEIHACRHSITSSCAACPAELDLAQKAKARVANLIRDRPARLVQVGDDKYRGRVVADLQVFSGGSWLSVAETLRDEGLAVTYDGGTKSKPWCTEAR